MAMPSPEASPAPARVYVRIENNSVYVFRSREAYAGYDLSACRTAVSPNKRNTAKLRRASRRGTPVNLSYREYPQYFYKEGFGPEYHLNWNFKGVPVNPLCNSKALLEITTVH